MRAGRGVRCPEWTLSSQFVFAQEVTGRSCPARNSQPKKGLALVSERSEEAKVAARSLSHRTTNLQKYRNPLWINRVLIQRFYARIGSFLNAVKSARGRNFDRVLDAGCGEGLGIERMSPSFGGAKVFGVDIQTAALSYARREGQAGPAYCAAGLLQLPFAGDSFDLVTCLETLEHLDDPGAALDELKRVTREWCLLSVPLEPCFRMLSLLRGRYIRRLGNHPEHIQNFGKSAFRALAESRFEVVRLEVCFPWQLAMCRKT